MGRFKIGLRTIKTAIAVFICLLVHYLLGTESGLLSCIAAVVCMKETVGKSWQMGLHRFLGTLIGGGLGYLLVTAAQYMPHYQDGLYVIILPLGMIICISLCTMIDKKFGVVISCVVFISIGLEADLDKASTLYSVFVRVVDTTIGIFVAGLVNRYFFPHYEESAGGCGNGAVGGIPASGAAENVPDGVTGGAADGAVDRFANGAMDGVALPENGSEWNSGQQSMKASETKAAPCRRPERARRKERRRPLRRIGRAARQPGRSGPSKQGRVSSGG